MTSTAAIDGALARHWPKRLARSIGVPIETARFWVYKGIPDARRREIAAALLIECDRLEKVIADTRRQWEGVVNEGNSAADGGAAVEAGPRADRLGE